jgi:tetratricopeptide (TPR) repeat protein
MRSLSDSRFLLVLAALAIASPALMTPAHAAVAAKSAKAKPAATKAAAPVIEPQPDPAQLVIQARDAQSRGESDLAVRLAQSAIVADPARPSSYDALAAVYLAQNQPEAARSYFGEALSIDPDDDAARQGMSTLDRNAPQQAAQAADQGTKTGTP